MFDAYELVGGMRQSGINRSVAMWGDLRAEGVKISVVGSSDAHGIHKDTFPHLFTVCFAKSASEEDVVAAIKEGRCVAVEAEGDEYERKYRCYGSLRLVSYAQYLLTWFFPQMQRICQGEGVMMRRFAMNEAGAELIEQLAEQSELFRERFFGRRAPVLPDDDMISFENKWRERQLSEGPDTKGSEINAKEPTRQI